MTELRTPRLLLRQWREDDFAPFAALNADPEVMRHFPAPLTRRQSDAFASRARAHIGVLGWGLWAVELEEAPFIGFVGLSEAPFEAHFTPALEVGWRLARKHWGHDPADDFDHPRLAPDDPMRPPVLYRLSREAWDEAR